MQPNRTPTQYHEFSTEKRKQFYEKAIKVYDRGAVEFVCTAIDDVLRRSLQNSYVDTVANVDADTYLEAQTHNLIVAGWMEQLAYMANTLDAFAGRPKRNGSTLIDHVIGRTDDFRSGLMARDDRNQARNRGIQAVRNNVLPAFVRAVSQ